ncbi:MAG: DEAD/DEAH box helicase [Vulcanimicrobiota bacterium]
MSFKIRYDPARAAELLRLATQQPGTWFRHGQEDAIRHTVEGKGRLLVVQRTGWGKSSVYFIGTKLLREAGCGPAILISPLLALMRNQIEAARRMGLLAETINSENQCDWDPVETAVANDSVDILLISPERLSSERFRERVLASLAPRISLLIVDEAHCVSDWGHDFRPHYRLLQRIIGNLPKNLRLLATTATANSRVMEDLRSVLGPQLEVIRGPLGRPSLHLQTIILPGQAERLAWLAEHLPNIDGSGIIYTLTIRDAHQVTDWLKCQGLPVEAYTGKSGSARVDLENRLMGNDVKALVATMALGMGFDKPDLAFVVHYQAPGSVVAYYQQVGRAGRALKSAYGVLLSGEEDTEITNFFIESAFPTSEEAEEVVNALTRSPEGLSVPELLKVANVGRNRIEKTLDLLALESPPPIVKFETKWQLTPARLEQSFWDRAQRLTELRHQEQAQMQEYVNLTTGHMDFLVRALDGEPEIVTPSNLQPLPDEADPILVQEAQAFLRRTNVPIEPRKQWPPGGLTSYAVSGPIPQNRRAQGGRALCVWGDAGWGRLVRDGKYQKRRFTDDLVAASAAMLKDWAPVPSPTWVTCIPSARHPTLVPDFAERLAKHIGLTFQPVFKQVAERPEQKSMKNSSMQALNLDGALGLCGNIPEGPVLLVDDMVDSRWTFTVAAWLLLQNGSDEVFPFALARTGFG